MNAPPYYTQARLARTALLAAIAEAQAMLLPAIRTLHFMASQHGSSPWRLVEAHCVGHATYDPLVLATITDLALMSEALAALVTILTEPTTSGSTKLAKVKRVSL